jgi:hypothetical protein
MDAGGLAVLVGVGVARQITAMRSGVNMAAGVVRRWRRWIVLYRIGLVLRESS